MLTYVKKCNFVTFGNKFAKFQLSVEKLFRVLPLASSEAPSTTQKSFNSSLSCFNY